MANEPFLYHLVESGEWKIDSSGRIWKRTKRGWKRTEHETPDGYLQIRKMINGVRIHAGAHRLVCMHFHGEIPLGMTVNHKNGIKSDNRPNNLEIVTMSDNLSHAYANGLKNQDGERNPAAKLSDSQIQEIRRRYATEDVTQKRLAAENGVAFQTISKIVRGDMRRSQPGKTQDYTHKRWMRQTSRDDKGRFSS